MLLFFFISGSFALNNSFVKIDDLKNNQPPACIKIVERVQVETKLKTFSDSLYYSTVNHVCENIQHVVRNSQRIASACKPEIGNNTYSSFSTYSAWSNELAAEAACKSYHETVCIDFISSQSLSLITDEEALKEKLCNACQRDYWRFSNLEIGLHPTVYYASPPDPIEYLRKIVETCGIEFFGQDMVERVLELELAEHEEAQIQKSLQNIVQ